MFFFNFFLLGWLLSVHKGMNLNKAIVRSQFHCRSFKEFVKLPLLCKMHKLCAASLCSWRHRYQSTAAVFNKVKEKESHFTFVWSKIKVWVLPTLWYFRSSALVDFEQISVFLNIYNFFRENKNTKNIKAEEKNTYTHRWADKDKSPQMKWQSWTK